MKVTIRNRGYDGRWIWETALGGLAVTSYANALGRKGKWYSRPDGAKRGFFTWRKKALLKLGATAWKADRTDIEFEVIR